MPGAWTTTCMQETVRVVNDCSLQGPVWSACRAPATLEEASTKPSSMGKRSCRSLHCPSQEDVAPSNRQVQLAPKVVTLTTMRSDAFESFVEVAADLSLLSPCDNRCDIKHAFSHLSATVGLSAAFYDKSFPQLITVKKGSPSNGGGTWLHPDLALYLAQWCNKRFMIQVSRWVKEWMLTGQSPLGNRDFEQEWAALSQRYDIRINLRDNLRPELMNATVRYAQSHGVSPIRLCSDVHDAMNKRIQGHKAQDLKLLGGLPLGDLLRDHLDVAPLQIYSAINTLALNAIEDEATEPVAAVDLACDLYLGKRYIPKPVPIEENIHQAMSDAQTKRRRIKAAKPQQLDLFGRAV